MGILEVIGENSLPLIPSHQRRGGRNGVKLLKFAGCIDSQELNFIREVIEKECEKINLNEVK